MEQITTVNANGRNINVRPDKCPYCHRTITPEFRMAMKNESKLDVVFTCPNHTCRNFFIGYYEEYSSYFKFTGKTSIGTLVEKEFNENIRSISPAFITIYKESFAAEQQNLKEICGVGYRKALEFLIKDYCILKHDSKKEDILKSQLANCIAKYVDEPRIKSVSKRAAWLGNDETHYVRTWEQKDLKDLKILIDLTLHWIEAEHLTSMFEQDMPDKTKGA